MKRIISFVCCLLVCLCLFVHLSAGSAWLQDPPSRSAAWYYQVQAPVNYNFRNLDCGGAPVRIEADGTRNCGICGDPFTDPVPRPNELGGKYANPPVRTRYYESGQHASFSVWNNLPGTPGFYEFRLCTDANNQSWSCFNEHLLYLEDFGSTQMPVPSTQGVVMVHLQLPTGVTCTNCVIQWRFKKEDSVIGCDNSNWCGLGRGPQVEYYNCADVTIGAVGQPKPDYIQDPVYTEVDYGGAYEVATTLHVVPTGESLNNVTTAAPTTTTTKQSTVPIIVIPTLRPATTIAPTTTKNPATTIGPITTTQFLVPPTSEQLVVDINGNPIPGTLIVDGNSGSRNNRQLLLLLTLLPLLGAASLRSGASTTAAAAPALLPPLSPVGYLLPTIPGAFVGSDLGIGNIGAFGLAGSSFDAPMTASSYLLPAAMPVTLSGSGIGFGAPGLIHPVLGEFSSGYSYGESYGSKGGSNYGNKAYGLTGNTGYVSGGPVGFSVDDSYGSSNYYGNREVSHQQGSLESVIYNNGNMIKGNTGAIMSPSGGFKSNYGSTMLPSQTYYPQNNVPPKYIPPAQPFPRVFPDSIVPFTGGNNWNNGGQQWPTPPKVQQKFDPVEPAARLSMRPQFQTIAQPSWNTGIVQSKQQFPINNNLPLGTTQFVGINNFPNGNTQYLNNNQLPSGNTLPVNSNQFLNGNTMFVNNNQFPNGNILFDSNNNRLPNGNTPFVGNNQVANGNNQVINNNNQFSTGVTNPVNTGTGGFTSDRVLFAQTIRPTQPPDTSNPFDWYNSFVNQMKTAASKPR